MSKLSTSIFDKIEASQQQAEIASSVEIARDNMLRQQLMEKAGELQRVHYIGPNGYIPGYYSPAERAFLPEFHTE